MDGKADAFPFFLRFSVIGIMGGAKITHSAFELMPASKRPGHGWTSLKDGRGVGYYIHTAFVLNNRVMA